MAVLRWGAGGIAEYGATDNAGWAPTGLLVRVSRDCCFPIPASPVKKDCILDGNGS